MGACFIHLLVIVLVVVTNKNSITKYQQVERMKKEYNYYYAKGSMFLMKIKCKTLSIIK